MMMFPFWLLYPSNKGLSSKSPKWLVYSTLVDYVAVCALMLILIIKMAFFD